MSAQEEVKELVEETIAAPAEEVAEEVSETVEEKAAVADDVKKSDESDEKKPEEKPEEIAKAGSRNSKNDLEKIQSMHDAAKTLGAMCGDIEKSCNPIGLEKGEVLEKADILKKVDDLQKQVTDLEGKNGQLEKALAEIAALPKDRKIAVMQAISKSDDSNLLEKNQANDLSKSNDPKDLIKAAHLNPVPLSNYLTK